LAPDPPQGVLQAESGHRRPSNRIATPNGGLGPLLAIRRLLLFSLILAVGSSAAPHGTNGHRLRAVTV
jgi:hypothetical protein